MGTDVLFLKPKTLNSVLNPLEIIQTQNNITCCMVVYHFLIVRS